MRLACPDRDCAVLNPATAVYCEDCGTKLTLVGRATDGYLAEWLPRARRTRLHHRLVVERELGRPLASSEHVHHKNGDRADNRPENLEVLPFAGEHIRLHWRLRREQAQEAAA